MFRLARYFAPALLLMNLVARAQERHLAFHPADAVDLRIGVLGYGQGSTVTGPTLPHGSITDSVPLRGTPGPVLLLDEAILRKVHAARRPGR